MPRALQLPGGTKEGPPPPLLLNMALASCVSSGTRDGPGKPRRTHRMATSCTLLMICFPTTMSSSSCASSVEHPLGLHCEESGALSLLAHGDRTPRVGRHSHSTHQRRASPTQHSAPRCGSPESSGNFWGSRQTCRSLIRVVSGDPRHSVQECIQSSPRKRRAYLVHRALFLLTKVGQKG